MNKIKHIAFIPDGNRRWIKKKFDINFKDIGQNLYDNIYMKKWFKRNINIIEKLFSLIKKKKIKYITLYGLSAENNKKRSKKEKNILTYTFILLCDKIINTLNNSDSIYNDIKINFIGNKKNLNSTLLEKIYQCQKLTENNNKWICNIAINYSGQSEILSATKKIVNDIIEKKIEKKDINYNLFNKYLLTGKLNIPNPDIIIRTGGYKGLSNFLLYQSAYTELLFFDELWPEIDINKINKYIDNFHTIKRKIW